MGMQISMAKSTKYEVLPEAIGKNFLTTLSMHSAMLCNAHSIIYHSKILYVESFSRKCEQFS